MKVDKVSLVYLNEILSGYCKFVDRFSFTQHKYPFLNPIAIKKEVPILHLTVYSNNGYIN